MADIIYFLTVIGLILLAVTILLVVPLFIVLLIVHHKHCKRAEQEQEETSVTDGVPVEGMDEDPFATGDVEEQMASAEELTDELVEEATDPMEDTDI